MSCPCRTFACSTSFVPPDVGRSGTVLCKSRTGRESKIAPARRAEAGAVTQRSEPVFVVPSHAPILRNRGSDPRYSDKGEASSLTPCPGLAGPTIVKGQSSDSGAAARASGSTTANGLLASCPTSALGPGNCRSSLCFIYSAFITSVLVSIWLTAEVSP